MTDDDDDLIATDAKSVLGLPQGHPPHRVQNPFSGNWSPCRCSRGSDHRGEIRGADVPGVQVIIGGPRHGQVWGLPQGHSPLWVLPPAPLTSGRPAPRRSGLRSFRSFLVAWAVFAIAIVMLPLGAVLGARGTYHAREHVRDMMPWAVTFLGIAAIVGALR